MSQQTHVAENVLSVYSEWCATTDSPEMEPTPPRGTTVTVRRPRWPAVVWPFIRRLRYLRHRFPLVKQALRPGIFCLQMMERTQNRLRRVAKAVRERGPLWPFKKLFGYVWHSLELLWYFVWLKWFGAPRIRAQINTDAVHKAVRNTSEVLWYFAWLRWFGARSIPAELNPDTGRKVVMLVCSQLNIDPRVEREARALASSGFSVTVLCPAWNTSDAQQTIIDWGPNVTIKILPFEAGLFCQRYPYVFGQEMLDSALDEDAWAYHAHDLNMALVALVAAARKGVACVCDFHEWFSENVSWDFQKKMYRPHPLLLRWLYQIVERLAIHSATELITVCQSIAQDMERMYRAPRRIHIIRNIPPITPCSGSKPIDARAFKNSLGIAPQKKIVLYQGGVGPSRHLEPVVTAMAQVQGAVLVIRGPGNDVYGDGYLQLARSVGAEGKVFCLPPIPSAQVVDQARVADLGLWTLLTNVGLNFKYSLPNKVFEYLAAGLPVLGADLPEVRRLLEHYDVGLCFDADSPDSIAACINRFTQDDKLRQQCRINAPLALEDLRADREWDKLVRLYRGEAA